MPPRSWRRRLIDVLPLRLRIAIWSIVTYRRKFGHWPNVVAPRSFNEKVQRHKILDRDPRIPLCADKVRVKDLVRAELGEGWVIPTLWAGPQLPPRAARRWPKPYVIKVNNGCGWNLFIRSAADEDWPAIEQDCSDWLGTIYGIDLGEWHYAQMVPQILVEPFVAFDLHLPIDYKFWVFHGRVEVIQVVTDREEGRKITFFDRDWRQLPCDKGYPVETDGLSCPASLREMIGAAERLGRNFSFVRVDLYEVGGRPLFGELTFYPDAGYAALNPPAFDRRLGELWR